MIYLVDKLDPDDEFCNKLFELDTDCCELGDEADDEEAAPLLALLLLGWTDTFWKLGKNCEYAAWWWFIKFENEWNCVACNHGSSGRFTAAAAASWAAAAAAFTFGEWWFCIELVFEPVVEFTLDEVGDVEEDDDIDWETPFPLFLKLANGKSGFTLSEACSDFSCLLHLALLFWNQTLKISFEFK